MKHLLIAASTEGIPQTVIIDKCRTRAFPAEMVREILQDWNSRKLAQVYEVKLPHSKRPVNIWRATTLILTERL